MLEIEPISENSVASCDCCGRPTRTVWGYAHSSAAKTAYFIHWAPGFITESGAAWDFVMGEWGEDAGPDRRAGLSLDMRISPDGPQFVVIDAEGRPFCNRGLFEKGLARMEVIGTPLAAQAFEIVDAVWAQDERILEFQG